MTTLEKLTPSLAQLFMRIDAASPTDELLHGVSDFWRQKRIGSVMPAEAQMADLPARFSPHVFFVRSMTNGSRHWHVTNAGAVARSLLRLTDERPPQVTDKKVAVRLRRLFELVTEKSEPHSAMFEIEGGEQRRQLVEVFAAPLHAHEADIHLIFAALNSRREAANCVETSRTVTGAKTRPAKR
jgi:hypothetical protein